MNPLRSVVAVLGGIVVIAFVVEPLEMTLVRAVADGPIADEAAYFAVRNRTGMLIAKLTYTGLAAVLGGYVTAKVAGSHDMRHAAVAALLQTAVLLRAMTAAPYGAYTPVWVWLALILLTAPAMLLGASIRSAARARSQSAPATTRADR